MIAATAVGFSSMIFISFTTISRFGDTFVSDGSFGGSLDGETFSICGESFFKFGCNYTLDGRITFARIGIFVI